MKVVFVRHLKTVANIGNAVFSGRVDFPLLKEKISAIDETVKKLNELNKKYNFQFIYSSNLGRAIQTAKHIISKVNFNLNWIITDLIRELDFGDWDGLSKEQIKRRWPNLFEKWQENPAKYLPPKSEDPKLALERLKKFLKLVKNRNVIAVSHKTFIRITKTFIEGDDVNNYRKYDAPNASIFIFDNPYS